jgi:hypothetical protein
VERTSKAWEATGMKRTLVILATAMGMAASSAHAHHSHPYFYDQCTSITIEGRVESVQWKDPHTLIVLRLDDGTAYTVDWNGLSQLTTFLIVGPAKAALVPGARIAVTGSPISAAQIREHFPDYTHEVNPNTVDPTLIRRVGNSWAWATRPRQNPPDCKGR